MNRTDASACYCPFVNRHEARCGAHLSLNGLDHAFDYCFGKYQSCPAYFELLIERRARRAQQHHASSTIELTVRREAIAQFAARQNAGAARHANQA